VLTPPVYSAWASTGSSRCRAGPACWWSLGRTRAGQVRRHAGRAAGAAGALEARGWSGPSCPSRVEALTSIRTAVEAGYTQLVRAAEEIDPTLTRPIQGAGSRQWQGTEEVEKKLVQHLKRRQETELGQLPKARAAVLPNQKPRRGAHAGPVSGPLRTGPFCGNWPTRSSGVCLALEARRNRRRLDHVDHRAHPDSWRC